MSAVRDSLATLFRRLRRLGRDASNAPKAGDDTPAGTLQSELPQGFVLVAAGAYPSDVDERDGYIQRVKSIDAMLSGLSRVYVTFDAERARDPRCTRLGNGVWHLRLADDDKAASILRPIAEASSGIYLHSIHNAVTLAMRQLLSQRLVPSVLDVHGAVPEERAMMGDPDAERYGALERGTYLTVDHVVCVSTEMAWHLASKHGPAKNAPIICPIFHGAISFDVTAKRSSLKPTVVYAGGTQVWQRVPRMLDLVARANERYDFIFMTPDTAGILAGLAMRDTNLAHVTARGAPHEEVLSIYPTCDFGLILREENVVNQVACPTKLIEYLRFGIIPVVESAAIGSFARLGMKSIRVDELEEGRVPDARERQSMALANLSVLGRLSEVSETGRAALTAIFVDGRSPRTAADPIPQYH